jgi:hypothetical protein
VMIAPLSINSSQTAGLSGSFFLERRKKHDAGRRRQAACDMGHGKQLVRLWRDGSCPSAYHGCLRIVRLDIAHNPVASKLGQYLRAKM